MGVPELRSDAARIPTLVFWARKPTLFSKPFSAYRYFKYFQLIVHASLSLKVRSLLTISRRSRRDLGSYSEWWHQSSLLEQWLCEIWNSEADGKKPRVWHSRGLTAGLKERGETGCSLGHSKDLAPRRGDTHLVYSLRRWHPQTTGHWRLPGNRTCTLCDTRRPRPHPVGSQRGRSVRKSQSKVTVVSTTGKSCIQKPCLFVTIVYSCFHTTTA